MSGANRYISVNTIKSLYSHSGNLCAFQDCNQKLMYDENTNTSNICHINGLNPDSARYDSSLDVEYLNSEANLILLCATHHAIIDANEECFTAEALKQMKAAHESRIASALSAVRGIMPNPSNTSYNYRAIQKYLCERYESELSDQEIKSVLDIFSRQSQDVKTVMKKIIEVYNRKPKSSFKMTAVIHELSSGDSVYIINIIRYLLEQEYINEWIYQRGTLEGLCFTDDGGIYDLSEDYPYRIEYGDWELLRKGMIVDALYMTQGI